MGLFLAGFVFIALYVASTPGQHLRYLGTGLLAACAAFVVGCLAGLIVGIPRTVSSGAMRHDLEARRLPPKAASASTASPAVSSPADAPAASSPPPTVPTPALGMMGDGARADAAKAEAASLVAAAQAPGNGGQDAMALDGVVQDDSTQNGASQDDGSQNGGTQNGGGGSQFTPSTNLAEISDWLTKLLLGAGLVELTRLGKPLASLINGVAGGLQDVPAGAKLTGAPVVISGALLVTYLVLGFLDGYIVTTLWYGRYLEKIGYSS